MRKGLITIAVLVIVLGVAALASGIVGRSVVFICWGVVLIAAIVFERVRYSGSKAKAPVPAGSVRPNASSTRKPAPW
jgi:hypothetical protein